jgi:hypothetical protein
VSANNIACAALCRANIEPEVARPMQAKFEARYNYMRLYSRTVDEPNPLISAFAADAEILSLQTDPQEVKDALTHGFHASPYSCRSFSLPCLCGAPIVGCCYCICCAVPLARSQAEDAAAKHHLTLRAHSLHYRVERYPVGGTVVGFGTETYTHMQCCGSVCCVDRRFHGREIEEVFPIEEVGLVQVESPKITVGGKPIAPRSLVVRLEGHPHAAAVIDAPVDGETFAREVMRRAEVERTRGGQRTTAWGARTRPRHCTPRRCGSSTRNTCDARATTK